VECEKSELLTSHLDFSARKYTQQATERIQLASNEYGLIPATGVSQI
jgi:hypothetical protein